MFVSDEFYDAVKFAMLIVRNMICHLLIIIFVARTNHPSKLTRHIDGDIIFILFL